MKLLQCEGADSCSVSRQGPQSPVGVPFGPSAADGAPVAFLTRPPLSTPVPVWLWPLASVLALLGLATPNPMLTSVSFLVLPLLVTLLWRPGEPPLLIMCSLMQWLQVVAPVLHADMQGVTLEASSEVFTHDEATWLSLLAVLAMASGMRLALKHRLGSLAPQIEQEVAVLDLSKVFAGYLMAFGLTTFCGYFAWRLGGLAQLVLAVGLLKWGMLWLLICGAFAQGRRYDLIGFALLLETFIGFLGFFSTFKESYFVLALALLTVRKRLTLLARSALVLTGLALLALMIFWQAIKIEYRRFVSDGALDQSVRVSIEARVAKLVSLAENLHMEQIERGLETLVERVGYTELIAATMDWVPAHEPHSSGELWKKIVLHPLMPRLLFPDKAAINDSEVTRRFTGRMVSGSDEGTSIGIGYIAESYADFGRVGMLFPLFALGYLIGRIYRWLVFTGSSRIMGAAMATAALFVGVRGIEIAGAKLIGALITASLVLAAINWLVGHGMIGWLWSDQHLIARSKQGGAKATLERADSIVP